MKKISFYVVCLFVFAGVAKAETLFDVLARTYQTSPVLQSSQAHLRAVDERVGEAKSSWRPYVGVEGNAAYTDQRFKNYPNMNNFSYDNDMYDLGVVAKQSVFSGFKTVSAVDYAESSVLMERENVRQTEQNVLLNAAVATVDVIQTRALLELQKNQETVLDRHYKSYQKRFKVGELTKTDVAQSEARLKGATAARIGAEGNLETAVANYISVVGQEPAKKIELDDLTVYMPDSLDKTIAYMKEHNPSLKAARLAVEVYRHNIEMQKGDLLPSLDVTAGAGYQWGQPIPQLDDNYDGHYWRVGATLSVPLYQGVANMQKSEKQNNWKIKHV